MNQLVVKTNWYDKTLLISVMLLIGLGLIMVTSSSLHYAEISGRESFYVIRHLIYLLVALLAFTFALTQPIKRWQQYGPYLLLISIALLIFVLFAGKTVNGSRRWLAFAGVTFQVSEVVKLFIVVYLAGYLVRRTDELQTQIKGFLKPLMVLALITGLLLLEPDFGASVVILATALAMLFLGGARLWQFIGLTLAVGAMLALIAVSLPHSLERLTTFLDPWKDPFGSGYQLTRSLIAFGNGGIFGQGLGSSLMKLSYLPEAHTDFVFAVFAEEFGLFGVFCVLALFFVMLARSMNIGRKALAQNRPYAGYLAYGIGFWLSFQALINIGVTSGALPTKGITLPFVSYGGSSLMICCLAIGILLRIDYEGRLLESGYIKQQDCELEFAGGKA